MLAEANSIAGSRVGEVLQMAGLTLRQPPRAGKFSLGTTQRLGMAAALVIGGVMPV
jgi:ABC-2 type transport system ATP-binding protein